MSKRSPLFYSIFISVSLSFNVLINTNLLVFPGFNWDRVNFSPRKRMSFGFNMSIMLITYWCFVVAEQHLTHLAQVLIASQGHLSVPCSASGQVHKRLEGAWWPKLTKEIFYTLECHAQYINWASQSLARHRSLGSGQLYQASPASLRF